MELDNLTSLISGLTEGNKEYAYILGALSAFIIFMFIFSWIKTVVKILAFVGVAAIVLYFSVGNYGTNDRQKSHGSSSISSEITTIMEKLNGLFK